MSPTKNPTIFIFKIQQKFSLIKKYILKGKLKNPSHYNSENDYKLQKKDQEKGITRKAQ